MAEVQEIRRSFWRGRAVEVLAPSRERVLSPENACPGCDWGHFEVSAAREAKRALFLETMQRIGKFPAGAFGDLPIAPSPLAYRIRNRFHLSGRGPELELGQFVPRTHRVESIAGCRAIGEPTSSLLPAVREALAATGAGISELATLEDAAGENRLARAALPEGPKRLLRSDAEAVAGALAPFFAKRETRGWRFAPAIGTSSSRPTRSSRATATSPGGFSPTSRRRAGRPPRHSTPSAASDSSRRHFSRPGIPSPRSRETGGPRATRR